MSRTPSLSALTVLAALCCGCVATQNVPVSTDPSGALVYLDGKQVCAATPCSVDIPKDQDHLLTILKDGYRQKDIPVRLAPAAGGGKAFSPDMITIRLRPPGQPDLTDQGSIVDTAVDLGMEVLQRVLGTPGPAPAPDK